MGNRASTWTALASRVPPSAGPDLANIRQGWLRRKVEARMQAHGLGSYEEYVRLLEGVPREYPALVGALRPRIGRRSRRARIRSRSAPGGALRGWIRGLPIPALAAEDVPGARSPRLVACNRAARELLGPGARALRAAGGRCRWLLPDRTPCQDEDLPLWRALQEGVRVRGQRFMLRDGSGRLTPVVVDAFALHGRRWPLAVATIQQAGGEESPEVSDPVALDRLRRDLTDLILHDLRSPLATSTLGVEAAERSLERGEEPKARRSLDMAAAGLRRLGRLVDSLLDASRLEAGQPLIRLAAVEPGEVLGAAAAEVGPALAAHNLQLELEVPPNLPAIVADSDMLLRAVINLLDNAIKFSPDGGRVRLKATLQDYGLLITVTDEGPGIAHDLQPRIFDKFIGQFLPGAPRSYGLGLSFCKLAVEAHGGWVAVDSAPGKGSTFALWLPARPGAEDEG